MKGIRLLFLVVAGLSIAACGGGGGRKGGGVTCLLSLAGQLAEARVLAVKTDPTFSYEILSWENNLQGYSALAMYEPLEAQNLQTSFAAG
jgi:hypothetical protein